MGVRVELAAVLLAVFLVGCEREATPHQETARAQEKHGPEEKSPRATEAPRTPAERACDARFFALYDELRRVTSAPTYSECTGDQDCAAVQVVEGLTKRTRPDEEQRTWIFPYLLSAPKSQVAAFREQLRALRASCPSQVQLEGACYGRPHCRALEDEPDKPDCLSVDNVLRWQTYLETQRDKGIGGATRALSELSRTYRTVGSRPPGGAGRRY